MQLPRFSDYSLRVLMFLAHRQGAHTTIKEVSDAHRISENHLMKVVHHLSKRGYVKTARGKGGGIGLAQEPSEIIIGQVVRDVEPLTPVECFEVDYDGSCLLFPNCRLRGVLHLAQSRFLETLDNYSVSDLIGPKGSNAKLIKRSARRALVAP